MTVAEFMARKERTQRKAAIKQARGEVENAAVADFLGRAGGGRSTELAVVLAERTVLDTLTAEEPIAFTFERTGRLEKLQVVLLARRTDWEQAAAHAGAGPEAHPEARQRGPAAGQAPVLRPAPLPAAGGAAGAAWCCATASP